MNTDEAAKLMIDGKIGVLGIHEYSWQEFRFCLRRIGSNQVWCSTDLPRSNNWKVKREPIKYSKYIWLVEDPKNDRHSPFLIEYLFGESDWTWSRIKRGAFNKHYKVTVEEWPE